MKKRSFDNLPPLSKDEALNILAKPLDQLELSSDYYKAVFHLFNYPGADTEEALLELLECRSNEQCISIARRKAIEILARHRCFNAIPAIARYLESSDPYLVENAVWALKELKCNDQEIIASIVNLLDDPRQNTRLLIQSLEGLGVVSLLPYLRIYVGDKSLSPGVRGASIAALKKISGQSLHIRDLVDYLYLPKQNDRQCAVNDIIDSGQIDLLPFILNAPVAPSFRIRALNTLWPENIENLNGLDLYSSIDSLIFDDPGNLELPIKSNQVHDDHYHIMSLLDTDFSKCCLSLRELLQRKPDVIWPILSLHLDQMKKDYGALYFLMILFRSVSGWDKDALVEIKSITLSCLGSQWPDFIKFKPVAILTLIKHYPSLANKNIPKWLNQSLTPYWVSRYAALLALELVLEKEPNPFWIRSLRESKRDPNRFVRGKAKRIEGKLFA